MRDNSLLVRWAGGLDFAALVTAAVLLASAPALTAGESTYDFNAAGLHPGALASQDHWQNRQGDSVISVGEVTGAFGLPTRLVALAAGPGATASRLNAPRFGYRLAGSETEAVFEFDTLALGTALLALGRDFDDAIPHSEYGFTFGISHQTLLFMRAGWDGGFSVGPDDPFESRLSPNDWVTVRLTANLVANGGDGLGTVSLRNNSRGESTFTAHHDLSNLPLGLNGMAPGAQPANWNGVYLRLENGGMIARLTLPLSPGNRPPNANSQSISGPSNAPLPITLTATDPDGDVLAFAVVTLPQFGTLTGTAPSLTYQSAPGQPADEFEFEVTDPHGAKSRASVRIRVLEQIRLDPTSASVLPGSVVAFAVSDGQPPFTFTLESNQSGATLHASGAYTAGPNPGTDTVRVTDGAGAMATATVTVLGCEPLDDLLGWWRGEGNALDSLGQSPGTPQQGATFAPGQQGQAFHFDGLDDYVEIPATPRLTVSGAFTVAAWVQPNTASASGTVITKYNSVLGRASWGLLLVEGGLHLYASGDGALAGAQWAQSAPNLVPANAWTHVAGTFDATRREWRLYVNGREVPSTLGREAIVPAVFDSPEPVRLGTFIDQNGDFASRFGGLLDEVLLYARALSPDEILAVSEGCRSAPPLAIQVDPQTGEVTLSWPLPADGWVVEWAPDLGPTGTPTWTVLPPPYTATATHLLVKVPATEAQRFFRLRPAGQ